MYVFWQKQYNENERERMAGQGRRNGKVRGSAL
jgi:hypothetical protein